PASRCSRATPRACSSSSGGRPRRRTSWRRGARSAPTSARAATRPRRATSSTCTTIPTARRFGSTATPRTAWRPWSGASAPTRRSTTDGSTSSCRTTPRWARPRAASCAPSTSSPRASFSETSGVARVRGRCSCSSRPSAFDGGGGADAPLAQQRRQPGQLVHVDDPSAAGLGAAGARLGQLGVERVVVRELLAGADRAQRDDLRPRAAVLAEAAVDPRVGIARVVDPARLVEHIEVPAVVEPQRIAVVVELFDPEEDAVHLRDQLTFVEVAPGENSVSVDGRTNDAQTWYGGHDATRLSPAARRVASFCSRDAGFAVRQALVQRRITSRVRFAKADEAQRLALWRHLLPRGARLADDVDLARLSTDFEMEGAHVQRALARAAFRVVAEGGSEPILGRADLEWAARVEYEDRAGSRTRSGAASRLRVRGRRDEARQGADLGLLLARAHGLVARLVDLGGIGPLPA